MKIYVVTKESLDRCGPDSSTEVICAYTSYLSAFRRVEKENVLARALNAKKGSEYYDYGCSEVELLDP